MPQQSANLNPMPPEGDYLQQAPAVKDGDNRPTKKHATIIIILLAILVVLQLITLIMSFVARGSMGTGGREFNGSAPNFAGQLNNGSSSSSNGTSNSGTTNNGTTNNGTTNSGTNSSNTAGSSFSSNVTNGTKNLGNVTWSLSAYDTADPVSAITDAVVVSC
jgi:predicted PurR-regulated permease PerM